MDQTEKPVQVDQESMNDEVEDADVDMKSTSVGVQRKRVKLKKWTKKNEKKGITIVPPMQVEQ
jgi:hypothetical protein